MFYQGARLNDPVSSRDLAEVKKASREANRAFEGVEHDIERLLMITEALWKILQEEHGYDDERLIAKVMEIDLEDGRLDGRVKRTGPQQCGSCGRALSSRHLKCIYCGTVALRDPFDR